MRPIDVDNLKVRLRDIYKRGESDLRVRGIFDDVKGIIDSLIDVIFGMALLQMCQDNTVVINM